MDNELLRAAVERWDGWEYGDTLRDLSTLDTILDGARKVANPIGTGLFCEIHWARMSSDVRCQAYQGQLACRPFHGALLALDVEEAPDGQ